MTTPDITQQSLDLFLAFARDAGNWNGTPLVGGNVRSSKEHCGNLTQLKKAGLIETFVEEGRTWLAFTEAGKKLAKDHKISID